MIFCYDIDGTICTNTNGGYEEAKPYPQIIAQLNSRYDKGHRIILFTARGSTTGLDWRAVTEKQLLAWNVKYHELRLGKPHADIYIDDKSFNPLGEIPFPDDHLPLSNQHSLAALSNESYLEVTYPQGKARAGEYPDLLAKKIYQDFFRRKGALLDVGCGFGEYLDSFQRLGMEVSGIDISPRSPEYAKPHIVKVMDFENEPMPFAPASFDFIFSKSVIEHLRHPVGLMSKARNLLKPGATALFMTPSWEYNYWGPFYIDHTHVTPFTRNSLKEAMQLAGYKDIQVVYFRQLPILWKYPSLRGLVWLIGLLPLPYRPIFETRWPEAINKLIRFSKEVMLLAIGHN